MSARLLAATLVVAVATSACDHQQPATADQINAHVGRAVIEPRFIASADAAAALAQATSDYCAEPQTADLEAVRQKWRDAWLAWQAASPFVFGPLTDERRLRIEFFPDERDLVEARVNALLARDPPPTVDTVANGNAPAQGLPALEYLLFAERQQSAQDCATLTAISGYLSAQLSQLAEAWPDYIEETFASAGDDGLTALVESITREVVAVRDNELGVPLGTANANTPQPRLAASPYAQESLPAMHASLATLAAILDGGGNGPGLASRIRERGAGTYSDDVAALIRQTDQALDRVDLPFGEAVVDADARVQLYAVYDGPFRTLRNRIQDLGGAVGVVPGFNADDGD